MYKSCWLKAFFCILLFLNIVQVCFAPEVESRRQYTKGQVDQFGNFRIYTTDNQTEPLGEQVWDMQFPNFKKTEEYLYIGRNKEKINCSRNPHNVIFRIYRYGTDGTLIVNECVTKHSKLDLNGKDVYIFIHGFGRGGLHPENEAIAKAWLNMTDGEGKKRQDVVVIVVDWGLLSGWIYGRNKFDWRVILTSEIYKMVFPNVGIVGRTLAYFIRYCCVKWGANPSRIRLVGHSMGAHVAGNAGRIWNEISKNTKLAGVKLRSITGLDPAGPTFQDNWDKADAAAKDDSTNKKKEKVKSDNGAKEKTTNDYESSTNKQAAKIFEIDNKKTLTGGAPQPDESKSKGNENPDTTRHEILPPGPLEEVFNTEVVCLGKDHAEYVIVTHTNPKMLGLLRAIGHIDLYIHLRPENKQSQANIPFTQVLMPSPLHSDQPYCRQYDRGTSLIKRNGCSHAMAIIYHIRSIEAPIPFALKLKHHPKGSFDASILPFYFGHYMEYKQCETKKMPKLDTFNKAEGSYSVTVTIPDQEPKFLPQNETTLLQSILTAENMKHNEIVLTTV